MQIQITIFMATFTGGVEKLSGATVNAVTSITDGALTQYGGVTAGAAGILTGTAAMTDGQVLIGDSTPGAPTPATITAGTGVTVTNGHHSITLAATIGNIQIATAGVSNITAFNIYDTPLLAVSGVPGNVVIPLYTFCNTIWHANTSSGGGDIVLQWGNTAHGAGQGAMAGPVAFQSDINSNANAMALSIGAFGSGAHFASSTAIGQGLYLSNAGSDFANVPGGMGLNVTIVYITVPMS